MVPVTLELHRDAYQLQAMRKITPHTASDYRHTVKLNITYFVVARFFEVI